MQTFKERLYGDNHSLSANTLLNNTVPPLTSTAFAIIVYLLIKAPVCQLLSDAQSQTAPVFALPAILTPIIT